MARLPHAAAHVFVADLAHPVLEEGDAHHLSRSLRLRPGEVVTASDGAGGWRVCRYPGWMPDQAGGSRDGAGSRGAEPGGELALEPDGPIERVPRPEPAITVGFALAKGDRPEWATQKLTEVGVDHIRPLLTARTVIRWDAARSARNHARLTRVAREAAMQARRIWLPVVAPPAPLAQASEEAGRVGPVALAHPGGPAPSLAHPGILVGPEGGWGPEELGSGLPTVGLGEGLLRVETAALAAAVLLCALRDGVVRAGTNHP